jgi:NAD(P)H-hydrate repair Nnr-like enzyme with NAD(P)H-hydrate dehydratase domain
MIPEFWHRQTPAEPLFPAMQWSRPENKLYAGKLLVVGGNLHGFAAAGEAFAEAEKAGAGTVRALLPDALRKTIGKTFVAGEFAPSTPSGSFGRRSLDELLAFGAWADGVLLAGDFGRNSETAVVLETFAQKYTHQLIITKDAADYFAAEPKSILTRQKTLFVISMAQLQKMSIQAKFPKAFTYGMDLIRLVETLHEFTLEHKAHIIVKHLDTIVAAVDGEVSTTKLPIDRTVWRVKTAAHASVWWLQNPTKPFEALSTAILEG